MEEDSKVPPPSVDFYQHVNKRWLDDPANEIPDEYSSWGGFVTLHDEGLKKQIALVRALQDKPAGALTQEERKISAIWEASAARFAAWERGEGDYTAVEEELTALDEVLMPGGRAAVEGAEDTLDRLAACLHHTKLRGVRNVLDFDKGSDMTNVQHVVLDLSISGLSLPSREYYTEPNLAPKREAFEQHLGRVADLLIAGGNRLLGEKEAFVRNVLSFEQDLAAMFMRREQAREYPEYFTNTTLERLHEGMNELRSLAAKEENYAEGERDFRLDAAQLQRASGLLERLFTLFGLREVLAANLQKNFGGEGADAPEIHHVTAYDGDGLRRVVAFLTDGAEAGASLARYRSYCQYKTLKKASSFCTKALDEEFFDFYSRTLTGQSQQKPADKRSIGAVNAFAGEMMGKIFVAEFFPPECKADVRGMIDETLDVMRSSIEAADWLTAATREKALAKLAKFSVKVGYPDKWKDYSEFQPVVGDSLNTIAQKATRWELQVEFYDKLNSVMDRTEWHMTPQMVNAYFSPTMNEIVFPAAILQPPFYHKSDATVDFDVAEEVAMSGDGQGFELAATANFGGIGAVIAHEITHGYDDKGRKFDGDGNLNDWWTAEDAALFKTKCDIMAVQADRYEFVDVDDGGKTYKQNAELCMGENLADLGGLSLSLRALSRRLEGRDADVVRASQRVAFKSWATVWKMSIKTDSRIQRLTTDPHAPCEFRGNLVQHMDEFYSSFGVEEGDSMFIAPAERLRMW